QAILGEAAAEPRPVPLSVPLILDGEQIAVNAVDYGGRLVLPLDPLAARFNLTVSRSVRDDLGQFAVGGMVVPGSFAIGSRAFAPVEAAAEGLGLVVREAGPNFVALGSVALLDRAAR